MQLPPCWVGGATADCIVDDVACQELAEELGVEAVIYPDMAHDMMLVSLFSDQLEEQAPCASYHRLVPAPTSRAVLVCCRIRIGRLSPLT